MKALKILLLLYWDILQPGQLQIKAAYYFIVFEQGLIFKKRLKKFTIMPFQCVFIFN